ncbi:MULTISPECIES: thermonuclease family protein [unclassified Variovorax]|uniref:thermonuclease family protein n=1 Tax=unclassified Variovorax TaxID=663243 RepID=UPI0025791147|nr:MULTISPECIES: thermonuclease family protein [unclassified Variovorax]MDM0086947.1 thermonuclease family protein [Variovorax sp. J22G40]MDM0144796.1 thermonuclease family protein [Variovorax sp. J2P1-31]
MLRRASQLYPVKVRLAEIDAPEKAQAFGERSPQSLAAMCAGEQAVLRPTSIDFYGAHCGACGMSREGCQRRIGARRDGVGVHAVPNRPSNPEASEASTKNAGGA